MPGSTYTPIPLVLSIPLAAGAIRSLSISTTWSPLPMQSRPSAVYPAVPANSGSGANGFDGMGGMVMVRLLWPTVGAILLVVQRVQRRSMGCTAQALGSRLGDCPRRCKTSPS